MKKNLILMQVLCLAFSASLSAQNIKIDQFPVDKIQSFRYLGAGPKHYYYSSTGSTIHAYDKNSMLLTSTSTYILDKDNEYMSWSDNKRIMDDKLYIKTHMSGSNETNKKYYTYQVGIYQFDPKTGRKIKVVRYGDQADTFSYSMSIDTAYKRIVVKRGDSIIRVLDAELDEMKFDAKEIQRQEKYKVKSFYDGGDISSLLAYFSNFKGLSLSLGGNTRTIKDSTSMEHFAISYQKHENKEIPFFESYIDKINLKSKNKDNKVKEVDFSVAVDKTILDLMYQTDESGNIIIIGKYMIKSGSNGHYGLFSGKYDKNMNELSQIKYYDLVSAVIENNMFPNDKYIGFIFQKFSDQEHKFKAENGVTVYLFQKTYNLSGKKNRNIQDHIYILKVESNGELIVSFIASRIIFERGKGIINPDGYLPFMIKNKLYFIFYENKLNLDMAVNEIYIHSTEMDKNAVLVSCVYDIESDDVSKKTVISPIKDFKYLPDINAYAMHYDPETQVHTALITAENKKGKTVLLYRVNITE